MVVGRFNSLMKTEVEFDCDNIRYHAFAVWQHTIQSISITPLLGQADRLHTMPSELIHCAASKSLSSLLAFADLVCNYPKIARWFQLRKLLDDFKNSFL